MRIGEGGYKTKLFSYGTKREPEMVLAPVRGAERSFIKANCSLLVAKENQKTTSDFDALEPRKRGCSPLLTPKGWAAPEKTEDSRLFGVKIF